MLNNVLLSRREQDASHRLYMWHVILAGNLILVSIILLCLATFCADSALRFSIDFPSSNFIFSLLNFHGQTLFWGVEVITTLTTKGEDLITSGKKRAKNKSFCLFLIWVRSKLDTWRMCYILLIQFNTLAETRNASIYSRAVQISTDEVLIITVRKRSVGKCWLTGKVSRQKIVFLTRVVPYRHCVRKRLKKVCQ